MADFVTNPQVHGDTIRREEGERRKGRKELRCFLILLSFLLFLLPPSYSQSQRARDLYQQGVSLFGQRKPTEAAAFFEQAIKESPTYLDAYMQLGTLYEYTRKPEPALATYKKVISLQPDPAIVGRAYQQAGNILLRLGRYADAVPYLETYLRTFPPQSAKAKQIQRALATARFGQEAVAHPVAVTPKPLSASLNVGVSQYFPVLTPDEQTIVFTALMNATPDLPKGEEELMTSTRAADGTWQVPVALSPSVSTSFNEGTASLSADGRLLVFTANQSTNKRQGFGSCDLYITEKTGDSWSEPRNLGPTINSRDWESQPSLSADGRQLYFVSDRPGGIGHYDIWRSERDVQGNWTEPVNLGPTVNTPFDEQSPFLHANGQVLFFASNGHLGLGGYDLFMSRYRPDSVRAGWGPPQNLGYPINTSEDQASLFVSANGSKAYYSFEEQLDGVSQQSRIYTFDLPTLLREQVRPVNYLKGLVADARTKKPLSAAIDLIDVRTNQVISRVRSDGQTGQYVAVLPAGGEYALYVSAPGYLFKSLAFNYADKFTAEAGMGQGMALDAALEPIGNTSRETLSNLFFESGRYELSSKSRTELERLAEFLKANPTANIEIAGHTDDRGEAAANLELSRRRAAAVVNYLTQMGIAPERLRAVGYGKTRPAVSGTTDEARQRNRRIEWRVL